MTDSDDSPKEYTESQQLQLMAKDLAADRPVAFGYQTMRHNLDLATQIWFRELYTRKTDYDVINWNSDLSVYGMPPLVVVRLAAFLFLLITPEYDKYGDTAAKIMAWLKQSKGYYMYAEHIIWIMRQMQIPKAQDRTVRNDILGLALDIVSDTDVSKFIGFAGLKRRTKFVYDKYKVDPDDESDDQMTTTIQQEIKTYINTILLPADLKIYFRSNAGLAMATEVQNKLKLYIRQTETKTEIQA